MGVTRLVQHLQAARPRPFGVPQANSVLTLVRPVMDRTQGPVALLSGCLSTPLFHESQVNDIFCPTQGDPQGLGILSPVRGSCFEVGGSVATLPPMPKAPGNLKMPFLTKNWLLRPKRGSKATPPPPGRYPMNKAPQNKKSLRFCNRVKILVNGWGFIFKNWIFWTWLTANLTPSSNQNLSASKMTGPNGSTLRCFRVATSHM